ncbi:MAG: hypothetical protein Fues2KO_30930 [Fuerstiella sp.]
MPPRRVVVTGTAMVTTIGPRVFELLPDLGEAASSGTGLQNSEVSPGPLADAVVAGGTSPRDARRMAEFAQLAVYASRRLIARGDRGDLSAQLQSLAGVVIGNSIGGAEQVDAQMHKLQQRGPERVSAFFIPLIMVNAAAGQVAIENRLTGPALGVSNGLQSSIAAVAEAVDCIQQGNADQMICGAVEVFGSYASLNSLLDDEDVDKLRAADEASSGLVGGVMLLEEFESACSRQASMLAEVCSAAVTLSTKPSACDSMRVDGLTDDAVRTNSAPHGRESRTQPFTLPAGLQGIHRHVLGPMLMAEACSGMTAASTSASSGAVDERPVETAEVQTVALTATCPLGYKGRLCLQPIG